MRNDIHAPPPEGPDSQSPRNRLENVGRIDQSIADSARRSGLSSGSAYDVPASPRASSANIWLSIVILTIALGVALWLLRWVMH